MVWEKRNGIKRSWGIRSIDTVRIRATMMVMAETVVTALVQKKERKTFFWDFLSYFTKSREEMEAGKR